MKIFVYPAVFVKDNEEEKFLVHFPDLDITTDGAFVEEAFLYAKEALKAYFVYIEKYDLDFNLPSEYAVMSKNLSKSDTLMLIDAEVHPSDLK